MERESPKEKLLTSFSNDHVNSEEEEQEQEEEREEKDLPLMKRVWEESKVMWVVAGPGIFTRFTTFGINVITQAFMGHIGSTDLAAFALVYTVLIRFANGILLGMGSALATLCGQAFGAKELDMMGVYLQRSWIIMFFTAVLLLPVFLFTTPILKLLGQDATVSEVAGTISLWSIPILFAFIISFSTQTFLQSQIKNVVIVYSGAFSIVFHIFLSWLLTMKFKLGVPGAMISTDLAFWIPNVGQFVYITCGWCSETWKGFSFLAFKGLWPVLKLSVSSGVMLCLELWYSSILILLTGNMKNAEVEVDALSICLNISGWELMIAFGFMAAVSVRVANELGKGSARAAKFSIVVTVLTSFTIGFLLFVFFLLFRQRVAYVFTSDEEVASAVGDLSIYLAFSVLLNSVQPVLSGVAIGAGFQTTVAYVNIGCYYIVGIPLGLVLGYVVGWQVKGIWIGMLLGTLVQTIVLCIITSRTDWDKQVIIARERVDKWSKLVDQETNQNGSDT